MSHSTSLYTPCPRDNGSWVELPHSNSRGHIEHGLQSTLTSGHDAINEVIHCYILYRVGALRYATIHIMPIEGGQIENQVLLRG